MGIKVSMIIPSYNRYPQNLLTLFSLQNQTFNPSNLEVIFVDDGSTDLTSKIVKAFHPPFSFHYIRCEKNNGRSKARNIGIKKATGEIIIFLDAEMIVNPDFVQNHYNHHHAHQKKVITGSLGYYSLFSFIFPELNKKDLKRIAKLVESDDIYLKRYQTFLKTNRAVQMIFQEDIDSLKFRKLAYYSQLHVDRKIISKFGEELTGFQMPWMVFLTGNVSVRKELLKSAGFFDETLQGWGFEDWELGYRLYKCGAAFAFKQNVTSYHQEHPVTSNHNWKASLKNFNLFQQKHPHIDVLVIIFILLGKYNRLEVHEILKQYKALEQKYPNRFNNFKEMIPILLKTALSHLLAGKPATNLFLKSQNYYRKKPTQYEHDTIKSLGIFNQLVHAFDYLNSL